MFLRQVVKRLCRLMSHFGPGIENVFFINAWNILLTLIYESIYKPDRIDSHIISAPVWSFIKRLYHFYYLLYLQ